MRKPTALFLGALLLMLCACGGGSAPGQTEAPSVTEASEPAGTPALTETPAPLQADTPSGPETPAFSALPEPAEPADSRVAALWDALDPETGVHLVYERSIAYGGRTEDCTVEAQGKGQRYYEKTVSHAPERDGRVIRKLYQDGVLYFMEDDLTGAWYETPIPAGESAAVLDLVCAALRIRSVDSDYMEEPREIEGEIYMTEVFPAGGVFPMEQRFCFDRSGALCWYIARDPSGIPEIVCHILDIDTAVDESMFDADALTAGYTLSDGGSGAGPSLSASEA